jgi:hypothetical protein
MSINYKYSKQFLNMAKEEIIRKALKKLKEKFPEMETGLLEKELIPLEKEKIQPRILKKKK